MTEYWDVLKALLRKICHKLRASTSPELAAYNTVGNELAYLASSIFYEETSLDDRAMADVDALMLHQVVKMRYYRCR